MIKQWLTKLAGTNWSGSGELWLDPEGNNADQHECKLIIEVDVIHYSWSYETKHYSTDGPEQASVFGTSNYHVP